MTLTKLNSKIEINETWFPTSGLGNGLLAGRSGQSCICIQFLSASNFAGKEGDSAQVATTLAKLNFTFLRFHLIAKPMHGCKNCFFFFRSFMIKDNFYFKLENKEALKQFWLKNVGLALAQELRRGKVRTGQKLKSI